MLCAQYVCELCAQVCVCVWQVACRLHLVLCIEDTEVAYSQYQLM